MKNQFLLNHEITYLNHGSFGACPKIVFEEYQKWQLELEKQPVEFLGRRYPKLLENVRTVLGKYVGSKPENVVPITNTTFGLNAIANSLNLKKGDEILTTNQEYGAIERMWKIIAQQKGFEIVKAEIPFPLNY